MLKKSSVLLFSLFCFAPLFPVAKDASNGEQCSVFNAVYVPYPGYSRSDGIHYEMTIENKKCTPPLCPMDTIHVYSFNGSNNLLSRLSLNYICAAGDSRSCYAELNSEDKSTKNIQIHTIALYKNFKQTTLIGEANTAPSALIFNQMPIRFKPSPNWVEYSHSVEFTNMAKSYNHFQDSLDEFAPEVWVLKKCRSALKGN